jgi:hypothetical protein
MTSKDIDKTRSFFKKKDQLVLMDGGTTNFFIMKRSKTHTQL